MDVGNVLTIEELLSVSDICISDYSSLVFEYSLFEKPLIFLLMTLTSISIGADFIMIIMNLHPVLSQKQTLNDRLYSAY